MSPDPRVPLLLSGPPASGKSSITAVLVRQESDFILVRKVKDSTEGTQQDYDIVSPGDFDGMIRSGAFLQWNARYGRRYGVLAASVEAILDIGKSPVIHIGRHETLAPLRAALPEAASVLLWTPPEILAGRLALRHADDPRQVEARLSAFREERDELLALSAMPDFDIVMHNKFPDAGTAAMDLLARLREWDEQGRPRNRDAPLALQAARASFPEIGGGPRKRTVTLNPV